MQVVTAAEMKRLDKKAGEAYGVPGLLLMDQASRAVAEVVEQELQSLKGQVVLFCGKGNNGGDGFGAARWLLNKGIAVKTFLVGAAAEAVSGDAAAELKMLLLAGGGLLSIQNSEDLVLARQELDKAAIVVDALLGTGFAGELKPLYSELCRMINESEAKVVAVDIPTGVNADNGSADAQAIKAEVTVTMALLKQGLLFQPGKALAGRIVIADIGMPEKLKQEAQGKCYYLTEQIVKELLPLRKPDAHKGDAGRVTVAAGSPGFTGAAAMAAYAAVKGGAGLVNLLTPMSARDILSIKLTEVMVSGLTETSPGILGTDALEELLAKADKADVLAIGPGLGTSEATAEVIRKTLERTETPVVIDADALTALKEHTEILAQMQAPKVLTPHPGEMARLTGLTIEELAVAPVELAVKYAAQWQAVVVLKGAPTVIACPDGAVYINSTGCNAMATGGSGDVLTGLIAALAAQGISLQEAALCGVYLHGLAGTMASDNTVGLAANEIAVALPSALKRVLA